MVFRKKIQQNMPAKLDLYPNIIKTIENKEIQAACFYTFYAKEFYRVNHEILISKLEFYGVRGLLLILIRSYLRHRKFQTNLFSWKQLYKVI